MFHSANTQHWKCRPDLALMIHCLSDSLLADFADAQDVGEESFFVSVNKILVEISWLHEMVGQDTQGTQVRHLWCQNLEHALDRQTQK